MARPLGIVVWGLATAVVAQPAPAQPTSAKPTSAQPTSARPDSTPSVAMPALIPVDRVWSGHRVGFALVTTATHLFVAYYDANRQLTVASRARTAPARWIYHKLDSWTGWDSHNYVAIAVDSAGQLHLAANMHVDPLVYYRTAIAGDVRSFARQARMADPTREREMTYPLFLKDRAGRLIFRYRDGASGRGNEIYILFDAATRQWQPLLDQPLIDGEGLRNAYVVGPVTGPDGWFHIAWVWRESPRAQSNHDLSYARSRDLVHWQRSDGTPLSLPIRLKDAEIVDPVPMEGGMINDNTVIGFDSRGRPMITFHKFDAQGRTQIYVARRDAQRWTIAQISHWADFRWDFHGTGSLDSRLSVSGPVPEGKDRIRVSVVRDGVPIDFILDAGTLNTLNAENGSTLATQLSRRLPVPPGMTLHTAEDSSGAVSPFALAWATLPPNRDLPGTAIPDPAVLYLVERAARP